MVFVETKKIVLKLIEEVNQSGIDDMPEILLSVHEQVTKNNLISAVYAEEYYLKILIMILIYRYCYGGEIK